MRVPKESEMPKKLIFISHISGEAELARALKQHLVHDFLGYFDVFVSSDGKTIPAGAKWLEELSGALRRSLAMVVLCSHESVTRPWVNFEAGGGWVRGIPVIPICHSGMTQDDLPRYEGVGFLRKWAPALVSAARKGRQTSRGAGAPQGPGLRGRVSGKSGL